MATVGTYDSTVRAGAASITITSISGSPTSYIAYDGNGLTIASGAMSGTSVTITAPIGGWPSGYSLIVFNQAVWNGGTGYTVDSLQILALRSGVAPLPPVPPYGTSSNAGDPNNRYMDEYMHGFLVSGPQRWQIKDAANPTVYGAGTEQGGTIALIQANIALDQSAGWSDPSYVDSARPRPQFVQFPNNLYTESGYVSGVTATVAALGPSTTYGVTYFEGLNEPNGSHGLSAAQSAAQYNTFRMAVKSGNTNALAMGPCEVEYAPNGADSNHFNPQMSQLTAWLSGVSASTLDAFSVHDYNAYNGDFIVTDGWFGGVRTALAAASYPANLPFFLTEDSVGDAWNVYDVRRLVNWTAQLYLTGERWGIPKEHIYWFFDTDLGGFDSTWLKEATGELRPQATFLRVYSEEVYGKAYSSALSFGTIGGNFYRGNVYVGTLGTCVALTAQGNPGDTVTLAVSDTGNITYSDWQGRVSTVTVAYGQITVPILDLPTYVRLSASCTVSVVDAGGGLVSGVPINIATTAVATSSTGSPNIALVNNGVYETGGYLSGPDVMYKSTSLPDAITLTWSTSQPIKKVVIRQAPPWANYQACAMIQGKLEYWNGSGWLPCPTVAARHWNAIGQYNNTTATATLAQIASSPRMLTWYDMNWCHNVDLSITIQTTALRWTVTAASFGEIPTVGAAVYAFFPVAGQNTSFAQLMCSEILVILGAAPPSTTYGAFSKQKVPVIPPVHPHHRGIATTVTNQPGVGGVASTQ